MELQRTPDRGNSIYYRFTPEQAQLLDLLLPSAIREAHTYNTNSRFNDPRKDIPSSVLTSEGNLTPKELQQLDEKYRIDAAFSFITIKPSGSNLGSIDFSVNRSCEIQSLFSSLPPGVISTLYQDLWRNSRFIREAFDMAGIPEISDAVKKQAKSFLAGIEKKLAKLSLIQPETTGVCLDMQIKELDPAETLIVSQGGSGFCHPSIPGVRVLTTSGLANCVAVAAYNEKTKAGFLAHLDRPQLVQNTFRQLKDVLGKEAGIIIYGGQGAAGNASVYDILETSRELIATIMQTNNSHEYSFPILGQDTLGAHDAYSNQSRSIALDSDTGQVFIPLRGVFVDRSTRPTQPEIIETIKRISRQI